jgi:nucleotide-binding universal stress UspA family protein
MYQKILIPLDGSYFSEHALEHLDAISMDNGPSVILLRVVEPTTALIAGGSDALEMATEAEKQTEADAHEYLAKIATGLKKKGMSIETVVTDGRPADEILNYATDNKVDLIIMSTHGRSGVSRWFFGSVAEKVIRHATVPVLISPPRGTRAGR